MKRITTLFSILILIVITVFFPGKTQAQQLATVSNFTSAIAFDSSCKPKLTWSGDITSSTIPQGHTFKIEVLKTSDSSSQSYTINPPANGDVNNATILLTQTIVAEPYEVRLLQINNTGGVVGFAAANTGIQPTGTSCLGNTPTSFNIDIDNSISVNSIPDLIQKVLEGLIKIGIPLLVVMIVYSGFLYLFARGNESKISEAHTMLTYTLIGGAILLGAWALAQLIHSTLIEITASIIQYFV